MMINDAALSVTWPRGGLSSQRRNINKDDDDDK